MTVSLEAIRTARATITLLASPADGLMCRLVEDFGPNGALEIARGMAGSRQEGAAARWAKYNHSGLEPLANELLAEEGVRFVIPEDPEWPVGLNDLGDSRPYGLWIRGDGNFPNLNDAVTITGSLDATDYGRTVATELASGLIANGKTIVTGGGYGIEAAAMEAANTDERPAVTVMAGGLGKFYPVGNADILDRQLKLGGLIVSESPRDTVPTRDLFQARHRLLAALSGLTLVPEARYNSRAVTTARTAEGLGRHVAAVPGSVLSANSGGTHRLIREGVATLVTDSAEAIELVSPRSRGDRRSEGFPILAGSVEEHIAKTLSRKAASTIAHDGLSAQHLLVLDALPVRQTRHLAELQTITGLGWTPLTGMLVDLVERGLVRRIVDNFQRVQK